MLDSTDLEARAFLREFRQQPEEVRRIFIYVICQTMVQAGLLEFVGAFTTPVIGKTLLYKNTETCEVFEIAKPDITSDEEQAINAHIREQLQESAHAA